MQRLPIYSTHTTVESESSEVRLEGFLSLHFGWPCQHFCSVFTCGLNGMVCSENSVEHSSISVLHTMECLTLRIKRTKSCGREAHGSYFALRLRCVAEFAVMSHSHCRSAALWKPRFSDCHYSNCIGLMLASRRLNPARTWGGKQLDHVPVSATTGGSFSTVILNRKKLETSYCSDIYICYPKR